MKDFIVIIATVVLGIALAAIIIGFKSKADTISTKAGGGLDSLAGQFDSMLS